MRTLGLFVAMGSLLAAQVPQTPNPTQQSGPVPGWWFDAGVSRHRGCAHDQGD